MSGISRKFFTSDLHFNHEAVIGHDGRPFASLDQMHEEMAEKWNAKVGRGDEVYVLGDFALTWGKRRHEGTVDRLLSSLNGMKYLVIGNHDREEVTGNRRWVWARHYHELKVDLGGPHRQRIVMFHYALRTWNQQGRGSWMLHGHSHGNLPDIGGKTIDMGCMNWGYAPVQLEEVAEAMEKREVAPSGDHHDR
jgi:calcineurin-like phosphoesterase family protein